MPAAIQAPLRAPTEVPTIAQIAGVLLDAVMLDAIEVDVSGLMIGDSIFARDLSAEGILILTDPGMVIAHVVPPTVYQEAKPAEGAAEPELVQKEKEKAVC